MAEPHPPALLEMKGIVKRFGTVEVLHGVDFTLLQGEVLALVGENGAGKSTLMKILAGNYPPTGGEICLNGTRLDNEDPTGRMKQGIGTIYQELNYYDDLTVAENLFVGRYTSRGRGITRRVDRQEMNRAAVAILQQVKLDVSPDTLCRHLSVAQKQLLEIGKAVSRDARIVIMDEPTSALNDTEVANLFDIIRTLKSKGVSVIYISHKMDEIFVICDRIHVMRDGHSVSVQPTADTTRAKVVADMVGRDIGDVFVRKNRCPPGERLLEAVNLSTRDGRVNHASFTIHRGEIVSLYGMMGSGAGEILESVFGLRRLSGGEIRYEDTPVKIAAPEDAISLGIAFVPAERKRDGLVLIHDIAHNLTLPSLKAFSRGLYLDRKKEQEIVDRGGESLAVKAESTRKIVNQLSGGNQQKIVIGKWLARAPRLLIVHEPTKGIDVGTKYEIYRLLDEMCQAGKAVLMVSSELPEVLALSDRVYIVRGGSVTAALSQGELSQEVLMKHAIGGMDNEQKK